MTDFTFGQVESTLATINGIADHKRVAFAGRLKHLQKNGLLGERDRPGRGKAAVFGFPQLMQFAIGVELLKFGLPPQRAAQLVERNWNVMRYSIYLATFTETEIKDRAEEHGFEPPCANWLWLVSDDALAELTTSGASEYDTYEAIEAVGIDEVTTTFDMMNYLTDPGSRRTMIISGTALARTVLHQVADGFRYATIEAMRADILKEMDDFKDALSKLDDVFGDIGDDLKKKFAEASANRREVSKAEGAEVIERLSPAGLELLTRFAHARAVTMTEPNDGERLLELARAGLFEPKMESIEEGNPTVEVTELGLVVLALVREREAGYVSS